MTIEQNINPARFVSVRALSLPWTNVDFTITTRRSSPFFLGLLPDQTGVQMYFLSHEAADEKILGESMQIKPRLYGTRN